MTKNEFCISFAGEELHCIEWLPDSPTVAVLQIVHGMVEYVDRYDAFARYLASHGIAVVGHDQPGHGKTAVREEDLGYIKEKGGSLHLTECAYRVTEYIKERFPDIKNFILGHSMGSFVVRRYITVHGADVSGAVIMGTGTPPVAVLRLGRALAGLIGKVFGWHHPSKLLTGISFSGYNSRFPKNEGVHAWISSDRAVVEKYDNDPFCSYTFRAAGFYTLYETLLYLAKKENFDKIPKSLSILVTAGKDDPVGSYGKGPSDLFELCTKEGIEDVALSLYDGMRHEILNEKEKEKVFGDLLSWILERTDK